MSSFAGVQARRCRPPILRLTCFRIVTYAPPTTRPTAWHGRCRNGGMSPSEDTGVLTCVIDMLLAADDLERAVQLLLSTVGRTESKSGCTECSIGRDAAEPARVRYNEAWTTEAAFRRHVRSAEFQRVLVAMDLSCEEPQVTIGTLTGRTGIAVLRDLHSGAEPAAAPEGHGDEAKEQRARPSGRTQHPHSEE